jgi:hypothetical protein
MTQITNLFKPKTPFNWGWLELIMAGLGLWFAFELCHANGLILTHAIHLPIHTQRDQSGF